MHDKEIQAPRLAKGLGLSRRQFMAASTGMAAVALTAVAAPGARADAVGNADGVLVPKAKRGIILYTVRDATSRDPNTSPYASGFKAVIEELGKIGYTQLEFAGYNQHANAPGGNLNSPDGARLLRKWLDDNGIEAEGNHGSVPSTITDTTLAAFDAGCEVANILGMTHVGTGGDPSNSSYQADWDEAAARWNVLGERAWRKHGLKLYTHNHDVAYSFLLDSGPLDDRGRPTRSTGIRRLEYFLANTDPKYVHLEMDIYWAHVAQYKHKVYTAPDGSAVTSIFDPAAVVAEQSKRFPLFHAKDGAIDTTKADGYVMTPFGTGDIDYSTFFRRVGAGGWHNPMYEQDNAPSGAAPGQSLEFAKVSYDNLAALRG